MANFQGSLQNEITMIHVMTAFISLIFIFMPESFPADIIGGDMHNIISRTQKSPDTRSAVETIGNNDFDTRSQNNFPYSELISAIIGALLGALVAAWLYRKESRRQTKIDSVKRLVSNRFDLTGSEFTQVLNEVIVIFADSEKTIKALDTFRQKRSNNNLVQLWREMSDAAKIPHKHISDELFLTAFNTKSGRSEERRVGKECREGEAARHRER